MSTPLEDQNFADDIVQVKLYEASLPESKTFLPWHRPRKQFVRDRQWRTQIERMLTDSPLADGTLRYLGLPGADLLDLRHFHSEICESRNLKLRFLGFNSNARAASKGQTELNVALDEVLRLPYVDQKSDVLGDNFALIAQDDSIACRKAQEFGPYDVINLDFCDGFGGQVPGTPTNNYYEAIRKLFAIQARSKSPWLLLLTTRADSPNINATLLEALLNKYIANLVECANFKAASNEKFGIGDETGLRETIATANGLLQIFLTGLCKWFLAMSLAQQPPTTLKLCSVIGYRVDPKSEHEDLISLALRFTPTFYPVVDPLNVASLPVSIPNECDLATMALNRVASRVDADKVLLDDVTVNNEMIESSASLLVSARYDAQAYREWLDKG